MGAVARLGVSKLPLINATLMPLGALSNHSFAIQSLQVKPETAAAS